VVENTLTSYNKWGEKESEKIYKNNTLQKVKSFDYNEEGLLISQTSKDANGKILYVKTIQYNP
jgi:YD repeat-containing protein